MNRNSSAVESRLRLLIVMMLLPLFVLGGRLWQLQVIGGSYYRDLSENNRTRDIRTAPARGYILDRNGRILVRSRPSFNISLVPEDTPDVEQTIALLAEITGYPAADLKENLYRRQKRLPFQPQLVLNDVSRTVMARVRVNAYRLPGVIVDVGSARAYPNGSLAAHLLGYVREITRSQLNAMDQEDLGILERYVPGDAYGQGGIERSWENYLRGRPGYVRVEVDAQSVRRRALGIVQERAGDAVELTIDGRLQEVAEEAFEEHSGALVAIDPNNGEILALASAPGFDPNMLSGQVRSEDWQAVSLDPKRPLRNRAIAEVYAPGSTFKLVTAVAGLAENKIDRSEKVNCPGYYYLGRRFRCHKRSGHGRLSLKQAIAQSCNVYFYHLGNALGVDLMAKYARQMGLGDLTGIDIPGEVSGLVPTEAWKLKNAGERWYPGDTLPVAIGQGYLSVTPLQLALATATIASGGKVYKPHLVRRVISSQSEDVRVIGPELQRELSLEQEIWNKVKDSAVEVVSGERGTGRRARIEGINVGGKTGTAQVASLDKDLEDHAWFVAFAPAEKPMIALAVLVEFAGGGGVSAAPIAKKVLERFFSDRGMLIAAEESEEASTG